MNESTTETQKPVSDSDMNDMMKKMIRDAKLLYENLVFNQQLEEYKEGKEEDIVNIITSASNENTKLLELKTVLISIGDKLIKEGGLENEELKSMENLPEDIKNQCESLGGEVGKKTACLLRNVQNQLDISKKEEEAKNLESLVPIYQQIDDILSGQGESEKKKE